MQTDEQRKEKDRNRKRQQRQDGVAYAKVKKQQFAQREIKRAWICQYLSDNPCVDCGESDIEVLEFDHRPDLEKYKEISTMLNSTYSLESIKREVAKCEVRCCNCHRRVTVARLGGSYRTIHKLRLCIGAAS